MLHIKFDQDWQTDLGDYIISLLKNLIRTQGHVTPKRLIRSSLNSNSSEILCLSWLPASLTKVRSKMNVLAWRHHFPTIFGVIRFGRNLNSEMLCLSVLHARLTKNGLKLKALAWRHRFPHYKSMARILIGLCQMLMQPLPLPSDATHKIWLRLPTWSQRYSSLNVWTDDGRTYHWYTISGLTESEQRQHKRSSVIRMLACPEYFVNRLTMHTCVCVYRNS